MSRLTDLIQQAKAKDPQLGADLEREFKALSSRRAFGLNFERHRPEAVELPQRTVRKGDKVRVLPLRGSNTKGDQRLWLVKRIENVDGVRVGHIELRSAAEPETQVAATDDLVVVAEFRDLIYPGLTSTGKVERGGDKPFHTVINGENFHVLKALTYTHRGKVDAIYIDPPYNTGAKDWKYNNDYVGDDDLYRHSKWLAFMERRLRLAKNLLNPDSSMLIVTIDEKEYLRLGLLLEQIFPEATMQMVTSVISAKGAVRRGRFSRVEEYLYFVGFGEAAISPWTSNMLSSYTEDAEVVTDNDDLEEGSLVPIEWLGLRRREPSSTRGSRPNQFYPIFVNIKDGTLHSIGNPIDDHVDRRNVPTPDGTVALWPLKPDGTEMLWGLTPDILRRNWEQGFVRVNWKSSRKIGTVYYLPSGTIEKIRSGAITVAGRSADGSVQGHITPETSVVTPPKRVWNMKSHNAEVGGTNILSKLIPGRHFPYPKSLYAVEDALRFAVGGNKEALIVDFFAGSGTTAHAVMRLNRQDGGRRQTIVVTNNEVSANEQSGLRRNGLRPGDPEWERHGICEFIAKPRLQAAILGETPEGTAITGRNGSYRFNDEFSMSEGLEENAEFFSLTYESHVSINHNRAFERIAPLLWMRAGSEGRRIDAPPATGWEVADTYGLLTDLDYAAGFCTAVEKADGLRVAYIVTNDDRRFQSVARRLPDAVEPVRLYESYLTNFRFANGD